MKLQIQILPFLGVMQFFVVVSYSLHPFNFYSNLQTPASNTPTVHFVQTIVLRLVSI